MAKQMAIAMHGEGGQTERMAKMAALEATTIMTIFILSEKSIHSCEKSLI